MNTTKKNLAVIFSWTNISKYKGALIIKEIFFVISQIHMMGYFKLVIVNDRYEKRYLNQYLQILPLIRNLVIYAKYIEFQTTKHTFSQNEA